MELSELSSMSLEELRDVILRELDRIWENEPDEVKSWRMGVFTSGAGSYGQYFSNLVLCTGDMRALSSWITPKVVLKSLANDEYTLKQSQDLFAWINLINADFLAYSGFVTFGKLARAIVNSYPKMKTKDDMSMVVEAWYQYANRLYFWVHQAFPWGISLAFPQLSAADIEFMAHAKANTEVSDYFEEIAPALRAATSE